MRIDLVQSKFSPKIKALILEPADDGWGTRLAGPDAGPWTTVLTFTLDARAKAELLAELLEEMTTSHARGSDAQIVDLVAPCIGVDENVASLCRTAGGLISHHMDCPHRFRADLLAVAAAARCARVEP